MTTIVESYCKCLILLSVVSSITLFGSVKPNKWHVQQLSEFQPKEIMSKISIGNQVFTVHFLDNETSKSLIERMPFTVDLEDYGGMEKIFFPKDGLNTKGAPDGAKPARGDIMYYAPWGDVAIFYKEFRFASGLIPMGKIDHIDGFLKALETTSTVTFTK
ncbi:hypothetical protein EP331_07280 [bacterium]|nr:MAG: hypothetical protein EP331_07280 [bacterium]